MQDNAFHHLLEIGCELDSDSCTCVVAVDNAAWGKAVGVQPVAMGHHCISDRIAIVCDTATGRPKM